MQRLMKWAALAVVAAALVVMVVYYLLSRTLDLDRLRPAMERRISEITGRACRIGGEMNFSILPVVRISFSDLRLGAPEGFSEPHLLTLRTLEIRLKTMPLLSRRMEVQRFLLREPRLVLETTTDGRHNWDGLIEMAAVGPAVGEPGKIGDPSGGASGSHPLHDSSLLPFETVGLEKITIEEGSLVWGGQAGGQRHAITALELVLRDLSTDRAMPLRISGLVDGRHFGVKGLIGPVGRERAAAALPVDLTLKLLRQAEARVEGTLSGLPSHLRYDLTVASGAIAAKPMAEALGVAFLPAGVDLRTPERLSLKGRVTGDMQRMTLTGGVLTVDELPLQTNLIVSFSEKPHWKLELRSEQPLDLDRFLPAPPVVAKPKGGAKPVVTVVSPPPVPVSAPTVASAAVDGPQVLLSRLVAAADITLRFKGLKIRALTLRDLEIDMAMADGQLRLDALVAKVFDGRIKARGKLDWRGERPAGQINLQVDQLDVGRLLNELREKALIEGIADGEVFLKLKGGALNRSRMLRLLEGQGKLVLLDGFLKGYDVGAMLRNRDEAFGLMTPGKGDATTPFSRLAFPFTIARGVLNTRDTRLDSDDIQIVVRGDVDLVDQELGLRLEPRPDLKTIQARGLMVPVMVTGTFDVPVFRPDLQAMANQRMGKKIVESKSFKKAFERPELKGYEEKARKLLKELSR